MKKVLFVCTGNTCRSPMAMYLFNALVKGEEIEGIEVDSAGLKSAASPISTNTLRVLASRGIRPNDTYISKALTKELCDEASVVIPVTRMLGADVEEMFGESKKVVTITDLIGRDVVDPYGQGLFEYETACQVISDALPHILNLVNKIDEDAKSGKKSKKKEKKKV